MSHAVLYVCHGSRLRQAREEAVGFINRCKPHIDAEVQEISFLELAAPSIEEGFDKCVNAGADQVSVVPLLLLTAAHSKIDIPKVLKACSAKHPSIVINYGNPIGVHEKMADSVINNIGECTDVDSSAIAVLIGRGSSDTDVKRELGEIAGIVQKKTGFEDVWTCFLTAAAPSFKDTLQKAMQTGRQVVFIPYLLFTGLLMKGIEKDLHNINSRIKLCGYLGKEPLVAEAFIDRIRETIKGGQTDAPSYD
ncbi:sirohydrochlorin chelatase [Mangrovibacillus sp. Mu-81]|uniref:sirohydrochlorin chelatase n=1 Tax=Mangrovibacillus sp. Mu-81 TaxID=3121478 RepID=UPI002FE4863A